MPVPIIKMATIGILPSPLKVLFYRMKGAKIGKNVSIGLLSIIDAEEIEIGDNSRIGPFTFISVRKLKLGKRVKINMMVAIETGKVQIENDSTVMEQVVIGGMLTPRSEIFIGKRVKIFPYSFLNPTEKITIEDDAGIGGANYIFTHGSWQSILDGYPVGFGPVTIKRGVWFPWRIFVMPNVTVGEYATIGAGSIITKDIPARCLAAGSPAKVLRTEEEYVKKFSDAEKTSMVIKIIKELCDFMTYLGKNGKIISETGDSVIMTCSEFTLSFSSGIPEKIPDCTVFVSLQPIPADLKRRFNEQGKNWFDLSGKETMYRNEFAWNTVKDFFSRYGIRFEIFPS